MQDATVLSLNYITGDVFSKLYQYQRNTPRWIIRRHTHTHTHTLYVHCRNCSLHSTLTRPHNAPPRPAPPCFPQKRLYTGKHFIQSIPSAFHYLRRDLERPSLHRPAANNYNFLPLSFFSSCCSCIIAASAFIDTYITHMHT